MNLGKLSTFQMVFMVVFVIAIIFAFGLFTLNRSGSSTYAQVTFWGTLPQNTVQHFLETQDVTAALAAGKVSITYIEKPEATFNQQVTEALASGSGPDAIIVSQDSIVQYLNKLVQIPYSSYSDRNFRSNFIQEAQLLETKNGLVGIPFTVDPMVMYWNRTLLANAAVPTPPIYWPEIYSLTGKINKIDTNHNITQSTVALGTYANIAHAKEIISLLMMQAGTPIVSKDNDGMLKSVLDQKFNYSQNPAEAAINYYTQFADPAKDIYSWNSSLALSRDAFTAGDLALYFGYASELQSLYNRNPNLNFDVAMIPQGAKTKTVMTYGKLYGMIILKSAKNPSGVFAAMNVLSSDTVQKAWSKTSGLAPVLNSALLSKPTDNFGALFYDAAIQSVGWLDPNATLTNGIFSDVVQSVLSNAKSTSDAVSDAHNKINQYIQDQNITM